MTKSKWMSTEEAIDQVMRSTGCSRRSARRKLAAAVNAGKLPIRETITPLPVFPELPPAEAVRRLDTAPETMSFPLKVFLQGLTREELLGELRSGRLIASGSETTLLKMQINKEITISEFIVSGEAMLNWMSDPETPRELIDKFGEGLRRKH